MGTPSSGLGPNRIPVDKSPVLAFLLTFFFGPVGLLYVKVVPALVLIVVAATGYYTFYVTSVRGLDHLDRLGLHRSVTPAPRF